MKRMVIDKTKSETSENQRAPGITTGRPIVLLAEDDFEMRRLLAEALDGDGYRVIEVGSGLQMFDRLRHARGDAEKPDLIVSDIRMPGLTGLEVLNIIREWGWQVPVILITAFGDRETRDEAFEKGVTAFLNKPFEVDDLRTAVTYFLQYPPGLFARERRPDRDAQP
jgi:CheY-like chemotaxis protein